MSGTRWQRLRGVAFVDDGHRIVVLNLMTPDIAKPQLLTGAAAEAWRAMRRPVTAEEFLELLPADSRPDVSQALALFDQLSIAGLCCPASHGDQAGVKGTDTP